MFRAYNKSGFTLIELLVTTTILAVLLTIVAVSFRQLNMSARDSRRKADIQEMRGILENYRSETGVYPVSWDSLPSEYVTKSFVDPLEHVQGEIQYSYRYQLHNLPGCTYELSAIVETGQGQPCPNCGVTDANRYCVTD